jgi:hypothetical protein
MAKFPTIPSRTRAGYTLRRSLNNECAKINSLGFWSPSKAVTSFSLRSSPLWR